MATGILLAAIPVGLIAWWLYLHTADFMSSYQAASRADRVAIGIFAWWGLSAAVSIAWAAQLQRAFERRGSMGGTFHLWLVLYMGGTLLFFWLTGVLGP